MKKIVGIIGAAAVLASSIFAADVSARVIMEGSLASGSGDTVKLLTLNQKDQKDDDALIFSINDGKAGANFQAWYKYDGSDGAQKLGVRSANVWFKPIDQIKVTIGDVSIGTYKEMIHWWKDPTGASRSYHGAWRSKYSAYAVAEGSGFAVEVTPVDGLWIAAAVAAPQTETFKADGSVDALGGGTAGTFFTKDSDARAAWGAGVKYDFNGLLGIPLTAAITYRDGGNYLEHNVTWQVAYESLPKILAIGADYGNPWANGIYAMLNARLHFSPADSWGWGTTEDVKLRGIAIDNYFKFSMDALKVHFRAPVTIRLDPDKTNKDPSYLEWELKVEYALDGCTPYLFAGTGVESNATYALDDTFGDTFCVDIKPGVTFNVGSCALDCGVLLQVPAKGGDFGWSVPFSASVKF